MLRHSWSPLFVPQFVSLMSIHHLSVLTRGTKRICPIYGLSHGENPCIIKYKGLNTPIKESTRIYSINTQRMIEESRMRLKLNTVCERAEKISFYTIPEQYRMNQGPEVPELILTSYKDDKFEVMF